MSTVWTLTVMDPGLERQVVTVVRGSEAECYVELRASYGADVPDYDDDLLREYLRDQGLTVRVEEHQALAQQLTDPVPVWFRKEAMVAIVASEIPSLDAADGRILVERLYSLARDGLEVS